MPLFHIVLVAILQGLTEFLPVSSSGHLILLPKLTGLEDQGQAIDIAVHVGTLGCRPDLFSQGFHGDPARTSSAAARRHGTPRSALGCLVAISQQYRW